MASTFMGWKGMGLLLAAFLMFALLMVFSGTMQKPIIDDPSAMQTSLHHPTLSQTTSQCPAPAQPPTPVPANPFDDQISTTPQQNAQMKVTSAPVDDAASLTAGKKTIHDQLRELESKQPKSVVARFDFQDKLTRQTEEAEVRPHHLDFDESKKKFPVPVLTSCPNGNRPDLFCTPNIGRDWLPQHTVFPISYSLPEELFVEELPEGKDQDCAKIIPRVHSTYKFKTQAEYRREYSRSFYCMTFKKGGWDVLRHYEIIAAGCMPYLVDIEYSPVYTLYHFPKKLILEARSLPGVIFNCSTVSVQIDHSVFPVKRYYQLLSDVITNARQHLTTKAMAKYVLQSVGQPTAKNVLYFHRAPKGVQLRAQGNYNTWTLFHGFRSLLGRGAVDSEAIGFLYQQPADTQTQLRPKLYGNGFGYAFMLPEPSPPIDRTDLTRRIAAKEFDLIVYADVSLMMEKSRIKPLFYDVVSKHYAKSQIVFLHAPDIPYPSASAIGYNIQSLYDMGVVFQREISDCSYYAPSRSEVASSGGNFNSAEDMKRCVWYKNKNCFDDVNTIEALAKWGGRYTWTLPTRTRAQ